MADDAVPDWRALATPAGQATPETEDGVPDWRALASPVQPERQPETIAATKPEMVRPPWQDTGIKPLDEFMRAMDKFNAFTEQATRGMTFGLQDKAGAAAAALPTAAKAAYGAVRGDQTAPGFADVSKAYHDELAKERAAGETYAENHPIASKVATGIGSVASLGPGGAEAAAPATLGGKVVQGIKGGSAIGGLTGFGQSNDESLAKTALDTATGAAGGAVIGGTVPVIAEKVVQPVIDFAARRLGPNAAENQAVRAITDRIKQSAEAGGPTAQDMLDLLSATPTKPLTLTDVGGAPVKGMAERIANSPGPGQQVIEKAMTERDAQAGTRLAADVDAGISSAPSAFATSKALMDARSAAAGPAYEKAFSQQAWSPRLQQFLDDPVLKSGLSRGMELERLDALANGRQFNPSALGVDLDAQGNVALKDVPNMRVLDAGKRGLDAMIADERNPITGKLSDRGRALNDVRVSYLKELDNLNGDYAGARAAYSGPSASMDAVRNGQAIFSKKPEEIASEIGDLSPSEKEFFKLGSADAIKEQLAKTGMGGDEAKRIIGNSWKQSQIKPLFDNAADYDRFIKSVTAENTMFNTTRDLLQNSRTSRRIAEQAASSGESGLAGAIGQAVAGAATGEPVVSSLGAFNAAKNLYRTLAKPSPEVDLSAARLLTNPNLTANRATLARILAQQSRPSAIPMATVPLSTMATGVYPMLTRLNPMGGQPASP